MRTRAHAQGRDSGTTASARAGMPGVGHCAAELPGPDGPEAAARMYRRQHHPGRRGARAGPWLPRAFQAGHRRARQLPSGATGAARYRGLAGGQLRRLGTHGHAHRRRLRGARRRARCTCRARAVHMHMHMPCTRRAHAVHMLSGHARVPVSALLRTGAGCPYARHQRRQACAPARQTRRPRSGRAGRLRLLSGRRPSRLRPAALWALEPELWDRVGPTVWPWSPTEALALPSPNPLRVELPGALGAQAELPTRAACAGTRRPRSPGPSVSREVGK